MFKIPLRVGWLYEKGLLKDVAAVAGFAVLPNTANGAGVDAIVGTTQRVVLLWEDELQFTVAQLAELGCFELGEFHTMRKTPI